MSDIKIGDDGGVSLVGGDDVMLPGIEGVAGEEVTLQQAYDGATIELTSHPRVLKLKGATPGGYSEDPNKYSAFVFQDGVDTTLIVNGELSADFFLTVTQGVPGEPPQVVLEIPRDIPAWIDSLKASVRETVRSEIRSEMRALTAGEIRRVVKEELGTKEAQAVSAANIASDLEEMGFDADK